MDQKLHDFYALLHRRDRPVAAPEVRQPSGRRLRTIVLGAAGIAALIAAAVWLGGTVGRTTLVSSTVELRRDPLPSVASVALPPAPAPVKPASVEAPSPPAPPPQTALVPPPAEVLTRPAKPDAQSQPAWI